MDLAERLKRGLGRALDTGGIGNVADDAVDLGFGVAQALYGGLQRLRLDIGQHDVHARSHKSAAEREPDAACPTRHERCLTGKVAHDRPCWLANGKGPSPLLA